MPSTNDTASIRLLLPAPFGPTIAVKSRNSIVCRPANDLRFSISRDAIAPCSGMADDERARTEAAPRSFSGSREDLDDFWRANHQARDELVGANY